MPTTIDQQAKNNFSENFSKNPGFLEKLEKITRRLFLGVNTNLYNSENLENYSFEIFPGLDKIVIRKKGKFILEVKNFLRNSRNSLGKIGEFGIKSNWNVIENENLPSREDIKRRTKDSMIKNMAELYFLYENSDPLIAMKINFPGQTKHLVMKKYNNPDFPNQEFYISFRPDGVPEFLLSGDYKIIERLSYS